MELKDSSASHQLCRVCNIPSGNYLPLFKRNVIAGDGELTTLARILSYCSGLELLETEHFLPQNICHQCVEEMHRCCEFKRGVRRMDRLLRQRQGRSRIASLTDKEVVSQPAEDFILVLDDQEEGEQQEELELKEILAEQEERQGSEQNSQGEKLDTQDMKLVTQEEKLKSEEEKLDYPEEKPDLEPQADGEEMVLQDDQDDPNRGSPKTTFRLVDDLFEIVKEREQSPVLVLEPKATVTPGSRSRRRKCQNPSLQCQICGKQLSTSNSFKYHMQLHGNARPYVCQVCGESFKTRNSYDGHVTLHDANNPNRCPTCGKVYRQASSLRTHLLTHSGIKPFECVVCGKRLTQKSGYKKHMLTHTGEKPHGCDICGRSFRYSSNLIAHKRCHSLEKPHECQVCHKRSFGSSSELNRHMLVHSSDRPFGCPECERSFKRQVSLALHLQSHQEGRGKRGATEREREELEDPINRDEHEES